MLESDVVPGGVAVTVANVGGRPRMMRIEYAVVAVGVNGVRWLGIKHVGGRLKDGSLRN